MNVIDKLSSFICKHARYFKLITVPIALAGVLLASVYTDFLEANLLLFNLYTVLVLDLVICSLFLELSFKPVILRLLTLALLMSPLGVFFHIARLSLLIILLCLFLLEWFHLIP